MYTLNYYLSLDGAFFFSIPISCTLLACLFGAARTCKSSDSDAKRPTTSLSRFHGCCHRVHYEHYCRGFTAIAQGMLLGVLLPRSTSFFHGRRCGKWCSRRKEVKAALHCRSDDRFAVCSVNVRVVIPRIRIHGESP